MKIILTAFIALLSITLSAQQVSIQNNHIHYNGQDLGELTYISGTCFTSTDFINPSTPKFWGYKQGGYIFVINEYSHRNHLPIILTAGNPPNGGEPECFGDLGSKFR